MRPLKLYEHPELKAEPEDVSLLTTICFVFTLALLGALVIAGLSCALFWGECTTCESLPRTSKGWLIDPQSSTYDVWTAAARSDRTPTVKS